MVANVGPLILIEQSGLLNPGYGSVCVQFVLPPHLRQFKESILRQAGWKKHEPARGAFVTVKHPRSAALRFPKKRKITQSKCPFLKWPLLVRRRN